MSELGPRMSHKKKSGHYDGKIAGLYDLEETIGRGHFAVVKLARHVFTGEKVAVKVIDKTKLDEVSKAHLFQEVRCMKLVQHPNVVRLYEVIDTHTKLYLILELGDGGDMYDYIMKHDKGLQEESARRYFKQIVQAIHYCHKLHVVHRDLKPENVVFFEKLGIVKLTDFGFSNKFVPGSKLETSCGSLAYSAPEILLGDSYDAPAVDVWSLGVILFMLVCGDPPFQEANDSETLTMIMDCKYNLPPHISNDCRSLIGQMLVREPAGRATLEDIMNHQWVTQGEVAPIPLMPLISREHISDDDNIHIVQKMVDGHIAAKEEILQSLELDAYDHITATYYLLAERRLKKHHEIMAMHAAGIRPHSSDKANLAPLALSPRSSGKQKLVDGVLFTCTCDDPSDNCPCVQSADAALRQQTMDSLVSPPGNRQAPSLPSPTMSPSDRTAFIGRRCSLIQEESIDEDDEEDADSIIKPKQSRSTIEGYTSDESDTRSNADRTESPSRTTTRSPRRQQKVRPLHSVRSSPQLLNQIFEEGESEEDDILPTSKQGSPRLLQRNSVASPEVLRKYETHTRKKRLTQGSRGTSCSSSDASDTDETDNRKRKEKLKQRFHRRDSSDHSSDTDGPSGPGGHGGSGRHFHGGGSGSDRQDRDRDREPDRDRQDDDNRKSQNRDGRYQSGGGGKQNGLLPLTKKDSSGSENNMPAEMCRKISNMSLASNLSNMSLTSLTSRSSKYVVGDSTECNSPKRMGSFKDEVDAMNEENKARTHVIHVRSKDFTDLVDRFNSGKEDTISQLKEPGTKFRRRSKEKDRVKTDINRNGLIARADGEMDVKEQEANLVKTKCCSLV